MSARSPRALDPDAPERVVKMRRWSHDPSDVIEVTLRKIQSHSPSYDAGDEVYLDGEWIGTVTSYTGSLDRKAGRLRIPGKRRKLWSSKSTREGARSMFEHVSRADAIRFLLPRGR